MDRTGRLSRHLPVAENRLFQGPRRADAARRAVNSFLLLYGFQEKSAIINWKSCRFPIAPDHDMMFSAGGRPKPSRPGSWMFSAEEQQMPSRPGS